MLLYLFQICVFFYFFSSFFQSTPMFVFITPCFDMYIFFLFFFSSRRRHTRWPRDWSSDVCSSDLGIMGLTALLASDYARFLKPNDMKGTIAIGFIPQIFCYGIMGGLGIWFGVLMSEPNPGVYIVQLLGVGGALFTLLTQLRINVTNIYSSSLSLSNFFENVVNFKPGRRFWVVVSGVFAMTLMLGGIVDHLDTALTFQGVFLLSWAAVLVTDALVVKRLLKIGPSYYEARQQYLYKWNPVGVASLVVASILGTVAALGFMGTFLESTAAFFAAILASVLTVVIAFATKGAYYTRYETEDIPKEDHIA